MSAELLALAIAAGVVLFLLRRAWRRSRVADFPAAFVPHVAVRLALRGQRTLVQGRHRVIFAVGRNGYTARIEVADTAQRVEAEFLKPDVALAHLSPGTAFSVLDGRHLVADGEVMEVLVQNGAHEPGQERRPAV